MATKKEVKEEIKEEVKTDEKKPVTIHLIPSEWDNAEFYVFGMSGKLYQINTGEDVEVEWDLAESIANVAAARKEARERARAGGKKK